MLFTIDVGFIYTEYRLKEDGTFKKFQGEHFKEVEEDDFIFNDMNEAQAIARKISKIEVDGETIKLDSSNIVSMSVSVRPHRTGKPMNSIFTIEEVKQALIRGNDNIHNVIIVDFDGRVRLIPLRDVRNTPHAVRFEAFMAGNGYVGPKSRLHHINNTYLALLNGWSSHLYSHDTVSEEYVDNENEEELLAEIKELIEEFQ